MYNHGQGNDSPQHQALMQLARAETVQEAEQLLSEMCLNQPTRISTLDAMIQQIQQNGIHPSSACCSAIITAFVDAGLLDRAKAYLQYIKAQHKDLPLRTYNVLIDAFGKAQDFQTMEELYELLLAEGITPNVITYNTMLFAFGKAGRFAKMDSFFNQMLQDSAAKGNGQEPCVTRDVTTFITLMDAHGRAGHIEQMEIYHRAMLAAGHKPSLKVYNALLSAYGKAQDIEQMTYYVNKMEANGIPPNTGSYNILIGVFGKMGKIDVMEQFYTALRQSGLSPDVFTYNSMLAAYGKALNEEKIQEIWQEMLACGVQPNVATYQNAIEAYSRLGHISMMEAMYHEAMRKGMQLGVWAYSSLLAAYCNAGDTHKVEVTFESMAVHKVHPNVRCFSSVIKAHAKAGDVETMEKRFRQLMASPGNRPDLEIFITVIKGYGPKYADRAINVFLAMKPSRVMPTVAACHAVLEVCAELNDAKELRRLWAHIPQFCKDSQCCNMYSEIMARLGETDVLGLVGKDDGGKVLPQDNAPPKGGKHQKRHPKGGRYNNPTPLLPLPPPPPTLPQDGQPQQMVVPQQMQQEPLHHQHHQQLQQNQPPPSFQQHRQQQRRSLPESDGIPGLPMILSEDLSVMAQMASPYAPQQSPFQLQEQMQSLGQSQPLGPGPPPTHQHLHQHQHQQQMQQTTPLMPQFLPQGPVQGAPKGPFMPQFDMTPLLEMEQQKNAEQPNSQPGQGQGQGQGRRNRQRQQGQPQSQGSALQSGPNAMMPKPSEMPWGQTQDQYWAAGLPKPPAQQFDQLQLQGHPSQHQHQHQQPQQRKLSKPQAQSSQYPADLAGMGFQQALRPPAATMNQSVPALLSMDMSSPPAPQWWESQLELCPPTQFPPPSHYHQHYHSQLQQPQPPAHQHQPLSQPGTTQPQAQLQQSLRALDPTYLPAMEGAGPLGQPFLPAHSHPNSAYPSVTKDAAALLQPNLNPAGGPFYYPPVEGGAAAPSSSGYLSHAHGALPLFGANATPAFSDIDPTAAPYPGQPAGPPAYALPLSPHRSANMPGPS